jgi:hypothetical protein
MSNAIDDRRRVADRAEADCLSGGSRYAWLAHARITGNRVGCSQRPPDQRAEERHVHLNHMTELASEI